jgi:8-amino-3,8-dideoxy-alpha-D-manno-octulosonate transaminase
MADMNSIMTVIEENDLILVEDAGHAFASFYNGTATGLFGKTGCYSFDFFKIATAGEGGVIVTNDENCYHLSEYYSDHGHNHIGNNRGMEQHPILGFNYRISELNAAVGVAQTRKVPQILEKNRKYKKMFTELLSKAEGISFAKVPDPEGDSATFLNVLLPNREVAKTFVDELNKAGIGGFNYWFTNMYHFINQWDHLKEMRTASKLPIELLGSSQDYSTIDLPESQNVVSRLVSFGIRCTWTEDEVKQLTQKIIDFAKKSLSVSV